MQTYIAHYSSPSASAQRAKGVFEFESDARANTKGNNHDARMRMLELYGKTPCRGPSTRRSASGRAKR